MRNWLRHLGTIYGARSRYESVRALRNTATGVKLTRNLVVMGIETSCDDTAVCVLSSDRRVLSWRRYADREVHDRLGGICPSLAAEQHRSFIDRFVRECLEESGVRLSDLDAVAVSTRPGLVIALRVGISKALSLSREGHIRFVNVHHMQAHATVASLLYPELHYPYVCVLISGGHALITIAYGPASFEVLASSLSGSPGECLDKLARALPPAVLPLGCSHPGAALEQLATRCSSNGHLRYRIIMPGTNGPNFNFSAIKNSYLTLLRKLSSDVLNVEDFCASVQHSVAAHIANKLHHCLDHINISKKIPAEKRYIVVSGGVASNAYIRGALERIGHAYGYLLLAPPPRLCCDNAEMVAWNGIQLILARSSAVIEPDDLPWSLPAQRRSPIGADISAQLPTKPSVRLSMKSIAASKVVFYHKPNV
ncbi:putative tRNA N6-adenosine threonylcarbamoyltransferase, mitochondrial [Toxocara canis]|uniref:N(6)-L-threonylcarbamoyladenine synthase n=2 Tax=Toxocara canis TaxID=6265 RepID=A0A0B2VWS5_TOXCA|nr:putative tRNA N6-adenosine threonylcarbamoyltransferase, mitochondrial [Toxocara canis]